VGYRPAKRMLECKLLVMKTGILSELGVRCTDAFYTRYLRETFLNSARRRFRNNNISASVASFRYALVTITIRATWKSCVLVLTKCKSIRVSSCTLCLFEDHVIQAVGLSLTRARANCHDDVE